MTVVDLAKHLRSRITIITPVFMPNEEYFTRCAKSIMNQTDQNFRWVLVVDGYKTKMALESFEIWNEVVNYGQVDIVNFTKHKGVSKCRNAGLERVTAGFVGFLDADNWFHTTAVELIRDLINNSCEGDEKTLIVVSQAKIICTEHLREHGFYAINNRPANKVDLLELSFMNRTDLGQIFHSVGEVRFDEKFNRLVDYDYLIALKFDGYTSLVAPVILSFYNDLNRDEHRISIECDFDTNAKRIRDKWKTKFNEYLKTVSEEGPVPNEV